MNQQERTGAIDKRRAEMKEVQRRLRVTTKEHDRLTLRAKHLSRELDALLSENNEAVITEAFGNA